MKNMNKIILCPACEGVGEAYGPNSLSRSNDSLSHIKCHDCEGSGRLIESSQLKPFQERVAASSPLPEGIGKDGVKTIFELSKLELREKDILVVKMINDRISIETSHLIISKWREQLDELNLNNNVVVIDKDTTLGIIKPEAATAKIEDAKSPETDVWAGKPWFVWVTGLSGPEPQLWMTGQSTKDQSSIKFLQRSLLTHIDLDLVKSSNEAIKFLAEKYPFNPQKEEKTTPTMPMPGSVEKTEK